MVKLALREVISSFFDQYSIIWICCFVYNLQVAPLIETNGQIGLSCFVYNLQVAPAFTVCLYPLIKVMSVIFVHRATEFQYPNIRFSMAWLF